MEAVLPEIHSSIRTASGTPNTNVCLRVEGLTSYLNSVRFGRGRGRRAGDDPRPPVRGREIEDLAAITSQFVLLKRDPLSGCGTPMPNSR